jgi:hypothetical protein
MPRKLGIETRGVVGSSVQEGNGVFIRRNKRGLGAKHCAPNATLKREKMDRHFNPLAGRSLYKPVREGIVLLVPVVNTVQSDIVRNSADGRCAVLPPYAPTHHRA